MRQLSFDFGKYCYGCGACVDVCPAVAIALKKGKGGFCFPKIDDKKCINCGLCERVCPHLKAEVQHHVIQKLYCAYHKDEAIRLEGSSGSVFYALAQSHIDKNQGVVVAAGFDSELQLRHKAVKTIKDVIPLMKSKYIQSSTVGIYNIIKSLLNDKVPVLFVGTPCQCQALINYVPEPHREKLTVVDFVCHGVPSQDLFNRWKTMYEHQHDCRVEKVSFREKYGQNIRTFLIESINNKTQQKVDRRGDPHEWSYYNGFLDHTTFRPSCFNCSFKSRNRNSDITLGDFWGLDKIDTAIKDFNKGYSLILLNSKRGQHVFEMISQDLSLKSFSLSVAIDHNYAFAKQDVQPNLSRHFLNWYSHLPMIIVDKLFLTASPSIPWRLFRKLLRIF